MNPDNKFTHLDIRKAEMSDLDRVMRVYEIAKKIMVSEGNTSQWQEGYPSRELLKEDIEKEQCFVCIDSNNYYENEEDAIIGVFVLTGAEESYENIYDGEWLDDEPYRIVHRVGSTGDVKGVGQYSIEWSVENYENIKIDTHEDNIPMQNLLDKLNFKRCGYITSEVDGTPRIAYQKRKKDMEKEQGEQTA